MHTSISGGLHKSLERAHVLGCDTVQIFSHNPRGWQLTDIDSNEAALFRRLKKEFGIQPVYIHSNYLVNLSSTSAEIREKSIWMLEQELIRADAISADYVIVHSGVFTPERVDSISVMTESIRKVLKGRRFKAGLLIENTAGGESEDYVELISAIINESGSAGLCLDTCHAFAAGIDIRSISALKKLSNQIEQHLGTGKIKGIHLNDSRGGLGSRFDRHADIGKGKIGMDGMKTFLNFKPFVKIPLILETPRGHPGEDEMNLKTVRGLISGHV